MYNNFNSRAYTNPNSFSLSGNAQRKPSLHEQLASVLDARHQHELRSKLTNPLLHARDHLTICARTPGQDLVYIDKTFVDGLYNSSPGISLCAEHPLLVPALTALGNKEVALKTSPANPSAVEFSFTQGQQSYLVRCQHQAIPGKNNDSHHQRITRMDIFQDKKLIATSERNVAGLKRLQEEQPDVLPPRKHQATVDRMKTLSCQRQKQSPESIKRSDAFDALLDKTKEDFLSNQMQEDEISATSPQPKPAPKPIPESAQAAMQDILGIRKNTSTISMSGQEVSRQLTLANKLDALLHEKRTSFHTLVANDDAVSDVN